MFEAALCELMDAMVSAGISDLEATELIGSLLTTIMSPEEIQYLIEHGKYDRYWA